MDQGEKPIESEQYYICCRDPTLARYMSNLVFIVDLSG